MSLKTARKVSAVDEIQKVGSMADQPLNADLNQQVLNDQSCGVDAPANPKDRGGLHHQESIALLKRAAEFPGKGPLQTALMLVLLSRRLLRTTHILITPQSLKQHSLSRTTAYRSLEQLESIGLITVHRRKGQGPQVSISTSLQGTE